MRRLELPPPNPSGLCQCGCGETTGIAKQGNSRKGWARGEHTRFLSGHHWRVTPKEKLPAWKGGRTTSNGYVILHRPQHPRADPSGYVKEHTVIAEAALEKSLPVGACLHHVNGDKADNRNTNLVLCENHRYHFLLHRRERALRECGNANWRKCVRCKNYDTPLNMSRHSRGCVVHRRCSREYSRRRTWGVVSFRLEAGK